MLFKHNIQKIGKSLKIIGSFYLLFATYNFTFSQGLKDIVPAGKYIGTAVNSTFYNNVQVPSNYNDVMKDEFNILVAENAMKMGLVLPTRPNDIFNLQESDFDFTDSDKFIAFAEANNMRVRGHALIWHRQVSDWVIDDYNNNVWTRESMLRFMESYITVYVNKYKGKVDEWDVVNEAIYDHWCVPGGVPSYRGGENHGSSCTASIWEDVIGPEYIDSAFVYAHRADPNAELFYNDYTIEDNNPKTQFMNSFVIGLKNKGVPIHGVGLQCHLDYDFSETRVAQMKTNIELLAAEGFIVNITELDLGIPIGQVNATTLATQTATYKRLTNLWLTTPAVKDFVTWGFTDRYTWLINEQGKEQPLIFDADLNKKDAYNQIYSEIVAFSGATAGPYLGTKAKIPGIIEFENYDYLGFSDLDPQNEGGAYRNDAVDITTGGTGHAVGWVEPNEYLEFTVDVKETSSTYYLSVEYASDIAGSSPAEYKFDIDGQQIGTNVIFPSTGGWEIYARSTEQSGITLTEGEHVLKLTVISGGANIDFVEFLKDDCHGDKGGTAFEDDCSICAGGNTGITPCVIRNPFNGLIAIPGVLQLEDYDLGGQGVSFLDNDDENQGNSYRTDEVDIASYGSGRYTLAWTDAGEWLEYSVDIAEAGDYDFTFSIASEIGNGNMKMYLDDNLIAEDILLGFSPSWSIFTDVIVNNVPLTEGEATLKIEFVSGGTNIDEVNIIKSNVTGIKDHEENELEITPNPVNNLLTVKNLTDDTKWFISNLDGQKILEGESNSINVSNLAAGIYILNAEGLVQKFVKE